MKVEDVLLRNIEVIRKRIRKLELAAQQFEATIQIIKELRGVDPRVAEELSTTEISEAP